MGRIMARHRAIVQFKVKGTKKKLQKQFKKASKDAAAARMDDDSISKLSPAKTTPSMLSIQPISKKKQRKLEKIARRAQRGAAVAAAAGQSEKNDSVKDVAMDVQ
uniref:Uncharacterized protein n=1 Tax=Plectus sambesii TaxID=2011161 RepID=A0A914WRR8_9BILA